MSRGWMLQEQMPFEEKIPELQTIELNHAKAFDYGMYRLANKSSNYDKIISIYIAKTVEKV